MLPSSSALGPVVALALFLVITVVAGVGFQLWFDEYFSSFAVEIESEDVQPVSIVSVQGTLLYVKNPNTNSIVINSVKIDGVDCSITKTLTKGISVMSIDPCVDAVGSHDIVLVSNTQGVFAEKVFIKNFPNLSFFISTWKTDNSGTSNNDQITLPLFNGGDYNFTVQWGDGEVDTITAFNDPDATHTYSSSGVYEVKISGTIEGWSFDNSGDEDKILQIKQWGPLKLGESEGYFYGADSLRVTASDVLNTTGMTNFEEMFRDAGNISTLQGINQWDTSSVTTMANAFRNSDFQGDLSSWDTSSVISMGSMFLNASNFNSDLSSWEVGNVTNMGNMFFIAETFNSDISSWDVSNVTNMANMFLNATSFSSDLSSWNVSSVTNMNSMFQDAGSFSSDLSTWDVSNVRDMDDLFRSASSFNSNLNSWDVSNITSMINLFFEASSFNGQISSWDTQNVTDMRNMFQDASNFNQDLSTWNVSSVTLMQRMFRNASSFNQSLLVWDVDQVTTCTDFSLDADDWTETKPNFTSCVE
jgi:surface protein